MDSKRDASKTYVIRVLGGTSGPLGGVRRAVGRRRDCVLVSMFVRVRSQRRPLFESRAAVKPDVAIISHMSKKSIGSRMNQEIEATQSQSQIKQTYWFIRLSLGLSRTRSARRSGDRLGHTPSISRPETLPRSVQPACITTVVRPFLALRLALERCNSAECTELMQRGCAAALMWPIRARPRCGGRRRYGGKCRRRCGRVRRGRWACQDWRAAGKGQAKDGEEARSDVRDGSGGAGGAMSKAVVLARAWCW